MKAKKLIVEQKVKLIEMCEKLFPKMDCRLSFPMFKLPNTPFIQMSTKDKSYYDIEIHWFEFCFTHLAQKLMDKTGNNFNYQVSPSPGKGPHVVDLLYEEFQTLSK